MQMARNPKPRARPTITLTTDFGLSDSYVAAMKAAILKQSPDAVLIDVTHEVPPQDILAGSISIERAAAGFGPGTVHLGVVDPGVGSHRKILIVEIARQWVVCPDNGLITWTWRRLGPGKAFKLTWRPRHFSDTFHGRDIMAPAAGMLTVGRKLSDLAVRVSKIELLDIAPVSAGAKLGQIIHIDHFGNATTNIPRESLAGAHPRFRLGRKSIGMLKRIYLDVAPGEPLALIGSQGLVEIAVRDGSAEKVLGIRVGDAVYVELGR